MLNSEKATFKEHSLPKRMLWGFHGDKIFFLTSPSWCAAFAQWIHAGTDLLLYSWRDVAERLLIKPATHAINILNKPQIRKGCLFVLPASLQRNCPAQFEMDLIALNSVCLILIMPGPHRYGYALLVCLSPSTVPLAESRMAHKSWTKSNYVPVL